MPKLHAASAFVKNFNARYAKPGTVDLSAAGGPVFPSETPVDSIHAAGVRSFTAAGKMQHVKVLSHFLVLGDPDPVKPDEIVELPELDAKYVVGNGSAAFATAEEVANASKPAKAGK